MIICEEPARKYFREKYGKELPDDFHGIDYIWSEKDLEMMEKYLNGECFDDFNGTDLIEYAKDFNDKLLEKYDNLSKENVFEVLEILKNLFKSGTLKEINYTLLKLVIEYKIIYNEKLPDTTFDEYIIERLKRNGNHKNWLGSYN
jgi:hypothetical protein